MITKKTPDFLDMLMQEALQEARMAMQAGDVPIGAVIALKGEIIARAHNEIERLKDATKHAELTAIQRASQVLGDWRLSETTLCVTLEPCPLCAGAIRQARIGTVVFAAHDEKRGALGSLFDLSLDKRLGALPRVISGIRSAEAITLLQDFFKNHRS